MQFGTIKIRLVIFTLTLFQILLRNAYAQLDVQHWIPPVYTSNISHLAEQYIYLSTPSVNPVTVSIMDGACGNVIDEVIISKANPARYDIGGGETRIATALVGNLNRPLQGRGYCLKAAVPFYANLRMMQPSQSGSLTAKGTIGAGTTFRTGKILEQDDSVPARSRSSYVGILALENGTEIRVSDFPPETIFANGAEDDELLATLNRGESYLVGVNMGNPNTSLESANALLGALVESTNGKPIVLSCGSILGAPTLGDGQDMGIDQPVPYEWVGTEYIVVRGNGGPMQETPIVVAHHNRTRIFVNGNPIPIATIDAGDYFVIPAENYGGARGNMYIRTSKPSYVYQMLSSTNKNVNLGMNFVPPINCFQPREVNNIASADQIGEINFVGGIIIVTATGAVVEVEDDNGLVAIPDPTVVPGRVLFSTYRIDGLVGNVRVTSSGALQVGVFGQSGTRGWAGYYAGFPTDAPFLTELNVGNPTPEKDCLEGKNLVVIGGTYDKYLWYKDEEFLLEETTGSLFTGPYGGGEYAVKGLLIGCGESKLSATISYECPDTLALGCPSKTSSVWVKPESMEILNNTLLSWRDSSGNQTLRGIPFNFRDPDNPPLLDQVENFYQTVALDGNTILETVLLNSSLLRKRDEISMFAVFQAANDGIIFSQGNADSTQIALGTSKALLGDNDHPVIYEQAIGNELSIVGAIRAGDEAEAYLNGVLNGQSTPQTLNWINTPLSIGGQLSAADVPEAFHNGNLAEIIIYPYAQNQIQREMTQTYLGLKYGFSLPHSLLASNESQLFEVGSPYGNDVAGIGKDKCADLNHKQSKNRNGTAILHVGLGDIFSLNSLNPNEFEADLSYSIWGHDGGATDLSRSIAGNDTVGCLAMERTWLITEPLAEVGVLKLAIPNTLAVSYLVVSNDEDFSNGDETFVQLTDDPEGLLNASFDFGPAQYFTFAIDKIPADAGLDSTVCLGDRITLSASEGFSHEWTSSSENTLSDPSIQTPEITVNETSYAWVVITDVNGCTSKDSVLLTVLTLPEVNAGTDQAICLGEETQLAASGAETYTWFAHPGLVDTNIPNPRVNPTTTSVYIVEGTGQDGCTNLDSVEVLVRPLPLADAGEDAIICFGDSLQLIGEGGDSFLWQQDPSLSVLDIADPIATPEVETLYILTVTDSHNCTDTDSVRVEVNEPPTAEAGDDIEICIGDLASLQATGGTSYMWEDQPEISDRSIANPTILLASSSMLTVSVTDLNGCTSEDSLFIRINPLPDIDAGLDQEICFGETTQVEVTGGVSYIWTPSFSTAAILEVSPQNTSIFSVVGTDENGCRSSDSVQVRVLTLPEISLQDTVKACPGEEVVLTASSNSPNPIRWSTGEVGDAIFISSDVSQTILVGTSTAEGCTDTARAYLEIIPLPEAAFTVDNTEDIEELAVTFSNQSVNAVSYMWDFGDRKTSGASTPTHVYEQVGEYTAQLVAFNELGCTDTTTFSPLKVSQLRIFTPSAFSPNGDGINDEFVVKAQGVEIVSLKVFNRWGNLIFEGLSGQATWDGSVDGSFVPEGVFIIRVEGTSLKKGKLLETSVVVTLVR
ncbi:MAG: PKD domain-containing protein [Bacteroidota bacterium]